MKHKIAGAFFLLISSLSYANGDSLRAVQTYQTALTSLDSVAKAPRANFKSAIFTIENAYWDGWLSAEKFDSAIAYHLGNIRGLIEANDKSDTMDFEPKLDLSKSLNFSEIEFTAQERKKLYQDALANWAIYTYLTDTTIVNGKLTFPFTYETKDPFGQRDWRTSQIVNLLEKKTGNCFAFTSLFKIFSDELNSGAKVCIAPGHIYIQHKDPKGDWYNVELASRSFPSDGSIQTLTYTYIEGIRSGISVRQLSNRELLALPAVYLGKSYQHKFNSMDDDFILRCAETALKIDPKNLNALLLKHQVLGERVMTDALKAKKAGYENYKPNALAEQTYEKLEVLTLKLYDYGHHQMPRYMQEIILKGMTSDDPIFVVNRTPKAFENLDVPTEDKRYSTLSGGLFEELHRTRRYEVYGRFILDTEGRSLVKMALNNSNLMLIDPVAFAMSIDPLAHEFPSWSPYVAFADNPIYFTDPDGRSVRPTNSRANQVLSTSFDNVLGMFPEIRERVRLSQVGTSDGQAVQAYVFDAGRNDGGVAMSISKARSIIKKSNLTNEQKLTAISYLNAVNQTDVFEFQVAYDPQSDQSFGVMTQNADLARSAFDSRQDGDNSDVIRNASASFDGEASYDYFFNASETPINVPNSNYPIQVIGLYNALPTSGEETQNVMNEIMFDMSGGAALFDDGYKHSVNENGEFSSKKIK